MPSGMTTPFFILSPYQRISGLSYSPGPNITDRFRSSPESIIITDIISDYVVRHYSS